MKQRSLHSLAWLGWFTGTLIFLNLVRNPLLLSLACLCQLGLLGSLKPKTGDLQIQLPWLQIALFLVISTSVFNGFTSHHGTTILFTIPGNLPLFSGVITLEALLYGFINGLTLAGMVLSAAVLNACVSLFHLLRRLPSAFYSLSSILSIALTFLPGIQHQIITIREAQIIRGHRLRGLRDWLPLFIPLLVGGLERALQVAEAMTARGWYEAKVVRGPSSHSTERWRLRDSLVLVGIALILVELLYLQGSGAADLIRYNPYPSFSFPRFELIPGMLVAGFLLPALFLNETDDD
jgi:energy-coupling factor transport system permease protein